MKVASHNTEFRENSKVRHQIRSFRNLAAGWHYGEGRGATDVAINNALSVYDCFLSYGVKTVETFPDIDGGVLVSGYYRRHTLDMLCTHDGYINLLHEIGDEEHAEKEKISPDEFFAYLGGVLWGTTKNLFGLYIPCTIVTKGNDLKVQPFKIHQTEAESPRLTLLVLENEVEQSANIYEDSILKNQMSRLSSGEYCPLSSHQEAAKNMYHLPLETNAT